MTTKARREQLQEHRQLAANGAMYVDTALKHLRSSRRAFGPPHHLDVEISARGACEAAVDRLGLRDRDRD